MVLLEQPELVGLAYVLTWPKGTAERDIADWYARHRVPPLLHCRCSLCGKVLKSTLGLREHSWDVHRNLLTALQNGSARCNGHRI